jgi:FkbM family methyltransferase
MGSDGLGLPCEPSASRKDAHDHNPSLGMLPRPVETQGEAGVDRVVCERFFGTADRGVFVDVGAAGPDFLSMSALYRQLGWRVIAIEPNPMFCDAHRAAGHEVLQYAAADRDADQVDFDVVDSHRGRYRGGTVSYESFSSLAIKPEYRALGRDLDVTRIKVDMRRLDTILAEHAPDVQRLDIVSVDVEGWELEVLDGLTFARYRPRVLIVENLFRDPRYVRAMRDRGYVLWQRAAPNDVYVRPSDLSSSERLMARLTGTWRASSARHRIRLRRPRTTPG